MSQWEIESNVFKFMQKYRERNILIRVADNVSGLLQSCELASISRNASTQPTPKPCSALLIVVFLSSFINQSSKASKFLRLDNKINAFDSTMRGRSPKKSKYYHFYGNSCFWVLHRSCMSFIATRSARNSRKTNPI